MRRQGGGDAQPFGLGARGLLTLSLVGNGAGLALGVANRHHAANPGEMLLWVVFGAFLVVGCLILARPATPSAGSSPPSGS
jgi:hypothetical protein